MIQGQVLTCIWRPTGLALHFHISGPTPAVQIRDQCDISSKNLNQSVGYRVPTNWYQPACWAGERPTALGCWVCGYRGMRIPSIARYARQHHTKFDHRLPLSEKGNILPPNRAATHVHTRGKFESNEGELTVLRTTFVHTVSCYSRSTSCSPPPVYSPSAAQERHVGLETRTYFQ